MENKLYGHVAKMLVVSPQILSIWVVAGWQFRGIVILGRLPCFATNCFTFKPILIIDSIVRNMMLETHKHKDKHE